MALGAALAEAVTDGAALAVAAADADGVAEGCGTGGVASSFLSQATRARATAKRGASAAREERVMACEGRGKTRADEGRTRARSRKKSVLGWGSAVSSGLHGTNHRRAYCRKT
jgi:hypothetical protein